MPDTELMSVNIIPSIIGERFEEIRTKLIELNGLVSWAQIDVVDGLFAVPPTWPYKYKEHTAELRNLLRQPGMPKVEVHLMVESPDPEIERWLASGASRIWFHYEATPSVNELLTYCETPRAGLNKRGKIRIVPRSDVGVALKLETPAIELDQLSHPPHFIQLMSITRIGSYGASFDDAVFPKIEYLRRKFPHATISIDGGVTLENAPELVAAGATQLVVGSAIWKSKNMKETIKQFKSLSVQ